MDRFRWCSQEELNPTDGERVICYQGGIRLYNGTGRTTFENGRVTLTTHRLIWQRNTSSMALPLAAITSTSVQQHSTSVGRTATSKIVLNLLSPAQLLTAFKAMPSKPKWSAPWVVDRGDSRVAMAAGLDFVRLGFTQEGHRSFDVALNEALEV